MNPPDDGGAPQRGRRQSRLREALRGTVRTALRLGERLPPGVRSVVGILLMMGGVLGFLPVLGFWMFPMGVVVLSLDVPPLRRRVDRWMELE